MNCKVVGAITVNKSAQEIRQKSSHDLPEQPRTELWEPKEWSCKFLGVNQHKKWAKKAVRTHWNYPKMGTRAKWMELLSPGEGISTRNEPKKQSELTGTIQEGVQEPNEWSCLVLGREISTRNEPKKQSELTQNCLAEFLSPKRAEKIPESGSREAGGWRSEDWESRLGKEWMKELMVARGRFGSPMCWQQSRWTICSEYPETVFWAHFCFVFFSWIFLYFSSSLSNFPCL